MKKKNPNFDRISFKYHSMRSDEKTQSIGAVGDKI